MPGNFSSAVVDRTRVEHKQKQCASMLAFGDKNILLSEFWAVLYHTAIPGGVNYIAYGWSKKKNQTGPLSHQFQSFIANPHLFFHKHM